MVVSIAEESRLRRKVGAIVITSIILILTLAYFSQPLSHQTRIDGIPVLNSVFAELVEAEPDSVVFPQFPVIETETSITMESDYDGLETVNESVAVITALEFISRIWYLSEINFSLNTGWTNLDDGSWHLKFNGADMDTYLAVNTISGKVNSFVSVWPID